MKKLNVGHRILEEYETKNLDTFIQELQHYKDKGYNEVLLYNVWDALNEVDIPGLHIYYRDENEELDPLWTKKGKEKQKRFDMYLKLKNEFEDQ